MLTVSNAFERAYERGHTIKALPKVIIEFNHNRYSKPSVLNDLSYAPNVNVPIEKNKDFPLSSIIEPFRPERRGVVRARVGEARTTHPDKAIQYRTTGDSTKYKYWSSWLQSFHIPDENGKFDMDYVRPTALYASEITVNKIVVAFETTWAKPVDTSVYVTYDGTTWHTVSTNPTIDSDGRITLYRNSSGNWTHAINRDNPARIRGVKVGVHNMSKPSVHVNLIELSARYEVDITDDVISVNTNRSLAEPDLIRPLGNMSANSASIELDNTYETYDTENKQGPFYNLIDKYARVTVFYGVDTREWGGPGIEYVPQGVYFATEWQPSTNSRSVTLNASDYTIFLQNTNMPDSFYIDMTPAQIINDILALIGFNLYKLDRSESYTASTLPHVWFTDSITMWDAIKQVAEADQGTGYFDEKGWFRYFSRDYLELKINSPVEFTLQGRKVGNVLPNVASVDEQYNIQANKVLIDYHETKPSTSKTFHQSWNDETEQFTRREQLDRALLDAARRSEGRDTLANSLIRVTEEPTWKEVWRANDEVFLRVTNLREPLSKTDDRLYISRDDIDTWPYQGYVNIEGEIIKYGAKMYHWRNMDNLVQYNNIESKEEKIMIDEKSHPIFKHLNHFTSRLSKLERGQLGTLPADHSENNVVPFQATARNWIPAENRYVNYSTWCKKNAEEGVMELHGRPGRLHNFTRAHVGHEHDRYRRLGGRFMFPPEMNREDYSGGFVVHSQNGKGGIYIEINTTPYINSKRINGGFKNIRVYRLNDDGSYKVHWDGLDYNVVEGQWVTIDVERGEGGNIDIYIDGVYRITIDDDKYTEGQFGAFVRAGSLMYVDYIYAQNADFPRSIDESTFYDKITGGFAGGYAIRGASKIGVQEAGHPSSNYAWFMYDFGHKVHEVREFDVRHETAPVFSARPYLTNEWDAFIYEGYSTPFKSNIIIGSTGRDGAVISGEDNSIFIDESINQFFIIQGNTLDISEETKTKTFLNKNSIRRIGEVELKFESQWIQTERQAILLGDYIVNNWAQAVDFVNVDGFFPPYLQLGDTVSLDLPAQNYKPNTHKYAIIGITMGFREGLNSGLSLRRIR